MINKNKTIEQTLILKALHNLVEPVKITLGAKGKTVLYNDTKGHDKTLWDGKPFTTKDGYTVAKQVKSNDDYEALVMATIKEASRSTVGSSGDGTTSTMILTESLIETGIELINKNRSSWEVCNLIDIVFNDIVKTIIDKYSISIVNENDEINLKLLQRVASVSANDKVIGKFIYDIYRKIGTTGSIEVQTSGSHETKLIMTEGMRLTKGYYSNIFTNNADGSQFKAKDVYTLVFNDSIRDFNQIAPFLRMTDMGYKGKKPLVIFCDEVSQIALSNIEAYLKMSNHPICIVQNTQFGDKRLDIINDIAGLTGGYPVSYDTEYVKSVEYYKDRDVTSLPEFEILGMAKEVLITSTNTSIISNPDNIDKDYVESTITYLKDKINNPDTQAYDKKHYKRRIANLTGGIALIKVGGTTEVEMKELYFRYEDAVLAVSSAIDKGVSIGGGYTWVNVFSDLQNRYNADNYEIKHTISDYNKILETLLAIPKQLLNNAGFTSNNEFEFYKSQLINNKCLELMSNNYMDVETFEIYDSTATLLDVVNNAVSVAKTLISVDKIIVNNIVYKG